jgi:peptide deformylase
LTAKYAIRKYPDPVLRNDTEPVVNFDEDLRELLVEMQQAMFEYDGVGLAAPQIGLSHKIAIVYYEEKLYTIINPEIVESSGMESAEEGCLSFPGIYGSVKRPEKVTIKCQDDKGNEQVLEAEGFLARAFCHEIDHLKGVLLIDHFSPMKKNIVKRKMLKEGRQKA